MKHVIAQAMGPALDQTRAGDLMAATRTIQAALSGVGPTAATPREAEDAAPALPHPRAFVADAEIVAERSGPRVPPPSSAPRSRRPLSEVVSALSALRADGLGSRMRRASAPVEVPPGARYERHRYTSPAGGRDYTLYLPAALPDGPQGLVLMLHGCTQDADDFARGTGMNAVAERNGLIVAYPEQGRSHNQQGCWNWFSSDHQRSGAGEPELLAGLTRTLIAEHRIPAHRVFAAGLSAGGAMAAILGVTHPEVFAAVGIHSGLPHGAARDIPSAFAAMQGRSTDAATHVRVPAIVFHGTEDTTVAPCNAPRTVGGSGTVSTHTVDGGRMVRVVRHDSGSEVWIIDGAGHAWSGGSPAGSYADAAGPDASTEMVRFFLATGD